MRERVHGHIGIGLPVSEEHEAAGSPGRRGGGRPARVPFGRTCRRPCRVATAPPPAARPIPPPPTAAGAPSRPSPARPVAVPWRAVLSTVLSVAARWAVAARRLEGALAVA